MKTYWHAATSLTEEINNVPPKFEFIGRSDDSFKDDHDLTAGFGCKRCMNIQGIGTSELWKNKTMNGPTTAPIYGDQTFCFNIFESNVGLSLSTSLGLMQLLLTAIFVAFFCH